jgi:hypothetical protein
MIISLLSNRVALLVLQSHKSIIHSYLGGQKLDRLNRLSCRHLKPNPYPFTSLRLIKFLIGQCGQSYKTSVTFFCTECLQNLAKQWEL